MIGPSNHLFHLSNYRMFIKGINWLLSAIVVRRLLLDQDSEDSLSLGGVSPSGVP